MTRAESMGLLLAFIARLITGAQGHWKGCPPKAEQRVYFANLQSHLDWVLIWAARPCGLLRVRSSPQEDSHQRFKRERNASWIGAVVFWAAWISVPGGATLLFGALSFLVLPRRCFSTRCAGISSSNPELMP